MTTVLRLRAPAKINLTLEVVGRLANGYHDIRSVFLRLDRLADKLVLRITERKTGVAISATSKDIPVDETNICYRAAIKYLARARKNAGVDIWIEKNIPVGAGLGGGSSDAAAVLFALNKHFMNIVTSQELESMGCELGKDVPFFLRGAKVSHVSGMGEKLQQLPSFPRCCFLIVNPLIAVSTKDAYQTLSRDLWFMAHPERTDISKAMVRAICSNSIAQVGATLFNDFEVLVERLHPIVKESKQALLAFGAKGAVMTGSGPTVFGLFQSRRVLVRAQENLKKHYPEFVFRSV